MVVTGSINKVRRVVREARRRGKTIGFVPTMGALHLGHMALVRKARKECGGTVVSIFVNPIQFGKGEDFSRYPRDFAKDAKLLRGEGIDLIFYPKNSAMYQSGHSVYVVEEQLSKGLCSQFRPGHFRGVCTVVAKLFNIVTPDSAYFGQKDYQQAVILRRLARDLNFPLKIKILPTVRDEDNLALSSRNRYLSEDERRDAGVLYASLRLAESLIGEGARDSRKIISRMEKMVLSKKTAKVEYIKIVDAQSLEEVDNLRGRILAVLAVYIGKTRLIDNMIIKVKG